MKKFNLYIPIYGENLTFLLSKNKDDVIHYIKKEIPKDYNDTWIDTLNIMYGEYNQDGQCFITCADENQHYIVMRGKPKNIIQLSGVIHEILHIISRILNRRGLHLSPETEEAYTYLQEWIFNEFCRAFKITIEK